MQVSFTITFLSLIICFSGLKIKILTQADRISEGTGAADDSRVEAVTEGIENITRADAESEEGMKPGNINAAAQALEKIADARNKFNDAKVTTKETQVLYFIKFQSAFLFQHNFI